MIVTLELTPEIERGKRIEIPTMQANDLYRIYTFDNGFRAFADINVVTPRQNS